MTQWHGLAAEGGQVLSRRADGALVLASPGAAPRILASPIAPTVWCLAAEDRGAPLTVATRTRDEAPHPFVVLADPCETGVLLRLPSDNTPLGAGPGETLRFADGEGLVFVHAASGSLDAEPPAFDTQALTELLAQARPETIELTAAMLRTLPIHAVRDAWSAVEAPSFHDRLYPIMRARISEIFKPFVGYTTDQLREQIARFGWSIGEKTYGRPLVMEPGRGMLTIGRYCALADPTIVLGNHVMSMPTTYPFMDLWTEWPGTRPGLTDHVSRDVVIGNDVWIGFHSTILPGAVIGDGAVIGAGSVVRGHVPPYALMMGNPAVLVRRRFPEPVIARLLALRWWDWSDAVVSRYIPLLLEKEIERFLDAAEQEFGVSPAEPSAVPRAAEAPFSAPEPGPIRERRRWPFR